MIVKMIIVTREIQETKIHEYRMIVILIPTTMAIAAAIAVEVMKAVMAIAVMTMIAHVNIAVTGMKILVITIRIAADAIVKTEVMVE
jgi:hypothetical protein